MEQHRREKNNRTERSTLIVWKSIGGSIQLFSTDSFSFAQCTLLFSLSRDHPYQLQAPQNHEIQTIYLAQIPCTYAQIRVTRLEGMNYIFIIQTFNFFQSF